MIQPNELRIFNIVRNVPDNRGVSNYLRIHYFLYEDGKEYLSAEILYMDMALPTIKVTLNEIEGITITKELLVEKCGFVAVHTLESADFYLRINRSITIYFDEDTIVCCFSLSSIQLPNIKYLHQLQNLIHILTGNELVIKM